VIALHETSAGVTFAVRVHPRAKRNEITGEIGDSLKISLIAPPVGGRANEACLKFLADTLNVPKRAISILSGHSSRNKIVQLIGVSAEEIRRRLAGHLA
jgi:uncharacterized protein (TIGR00251 family)